MGVHSSTKLVFLVDVRSALNEQRRGPAHALWCCAHGRGAAACDALLVSAARGVQRAQQGAARALFPILSPILLPIFGKAKTAIFPPKKISWWVALE